MHTKKCFVLTCVVPNLVVVMFQSLKILYLWYGRIILTYYLVLLHVFNQRLSVVLNASNKSNTMLDNIVSWAALFHFPVFQVMCILFTLQIYWMKVVFCAKMISRFNLFKAVRDRAVAGQPRCSHVNGKDVYCRCTARVFNSGAAFELQRRLWPLAVIDTEYPCGKAVCFFTSFLVATIPFKESVLFVRSVLAIKDCCQGF